MSWLALLREPEIVVSRRREAGEARPRLARLLLLAAAGSALFGAAVGCYVGRLQILLAAVKMPVFLLGTLAISFLAMHVFAQFAAPGLSVGRTFGLCLTSVATTAVGLAALAPVAAFLGLCAPIPSYNTYLFLVMFLVVCVGGTGGLSLRRLRHALVRLEIPRKRARRIRAAWLLIYGFVGSQMGWLLRPWVGSSYDVEGYFSITRNMEGNFYETVFRILVNLFRTSF